MHTYIQHFQTFVTVKLLL